MNFEDFRFIIESKLFINALTFLDLQVLGKRYKQITQGQELI